MSRKLWVTSCDTLCHGKSKSAHQFWDFHFRVVSLFLSPWRSPDQGSLYSVSSRNVTDVAFLRWFFVTRWWHPLVACGFAWSCCKDFLVVSLLCPLSVENHLHPHPSCNAAGNFCKSYFCEWLHQVPQKWYFSQPKTQAWILFGLLASDLSSSERGGSY